MYNRIAQMKQSSGPILGCLIRPRHKLGTGIFGVASVIATLVHQILTYLINERVILKALSQGFPMIPKTAQKVTIVLVI